MGQVIYLNEYQQLSKRTIPFDSPRKEVISNFAMGLTGEAGEVSDLLKKVLYHGHEMSIDDLEEELGDVLFYLSGLATLHGLTLSDIAETNRQKLLKRYPNGFSEADSINRSVF